MRIAIVLGKELYNDGSMMEELKERIENGIKCFTENSLDLMVFSGGRGNILSKKTEADAMMEYVMDKYPSLKEHIILEKKSKNTVQNARESKKLLDSLGVQIDCIYLVSSKYHFERENFPKAHVLFENEFKGVEIIKVY